MNIVLERYHWLISVIALFEASVIVLLTGFKLVDVFIEKIFN